MGSVQGYAERGKIDVFKINDDDDDDDIVYNIKIKKIDRLF